MPGLDVFSQSAATSQFGLPFGEPEAGPAKSAVKGEISFGPFGDAKPEVHMPYRATARNLAITVGLWAKGETR